MTVFRLDERLVFPPARLAGDDGLLAVGGDLAPERLLLAYSQGIFPWYENRLGPWWYSPDPRMALVPKELHVPRSLRKTMTQERYRVTLDGAFAEVIEGCASTPRRHEDRTWISPRFATAYKHLHELGFAHSAEAWRGEELVGGLYGISLGAAFFGESMFAKAPDASKVAFVTLVRQLERWDVRLVDCQVYTEHLARFGAREWARKNYLAALRTALRRPTRRGRWHLDPGPEDAA